MYDSVRCDDPGRESLKTRMLNPSEKNFDFLRIALYLKQQSNNYTKTAFMKSMTKLIASIIALCGLPFGFSQTLPSFMNLTNSHYYLRSCYSCEGINYSKSLYRNCLVQSSL